MSQLCKNVEVLTAMAIINSEEGIGLIRALFKLKDMCMSIFHGYSISGLE
jgi:hypothetical protein